MINKLDFIRQYIFEGDARLVSPMDMYYAAESDVVTVHTRGILPNIRLDYQDVLGNQKRIERTNSVAGKYENIFNENIFNRYLTMHPKRVLWYKLVYNPLGEQLLSSAINRYNAAIFQQGSYAFSSGHNATQAYISENNFNGDTFSDWIKGILLRYLVEDPNGVIVVLRKDNIIATEPAQPTLHFISSDKILHRPSDSESYLVFCKHHRNCPDNTYYVIDNDVTWLYSRKNGVVESTYTYYKNYGFAPYTILGGEVRNVEIEHYIGGTRTTRNEVYYASYLKFIIGDLFALCREYIHFQGDRKDGIPMRGIIARNCDTCNGNGHIRGDCGEGDEKFGAPECTETCKSCGGSGTIISINQGDVIEFNEDMLKNIGGVDGAVKWFNPDTSIITTSFDILKDKQKSIEKKLFIYQSESSAQESAKSKQISLESATMFIGKLADRLFDISALLLRAVAAYIQMSAKPEYDTIRNTNYQLKDELDLQQELILYTTNGLSSLANQTAKQLAAKNGNATELKKLQYLEVYSHLSNKTEADILLLGNTFGQQSEAWIMLMKLRTFGDGMLNQVIQEFGTDWFISANLSDIHQRVINELNKLNFTNANRPVF